METKVDLTSSRRKSLANDLPIWPTLSGSGTRLQSKNGWWSCDSVVGRSDILLCPVTFTLQKSKPDQGCGCVRDPTVDYHGGYWVYPLCYTKLSPYEINHLFVFKVFVVVVCPPVVFCSYSAFKWLMSEYSLKYCFPSCLQGSTSLEHPSTFTSSSMQQPRDRHSFVQEHFQAQYR